MVEFLPQRVFDGYVIKYTGNKYVKHCGFWNQLEVMVFGHVTNRDNLCDQNVAIDAHNQNSYHLGFEKNVTRSNLSKVNEKRDSKIFQDFAYYLIDIARKKERIMTLKYKVKFKHLYV